MTGDALKHRIRLEAEALGFALCGFSDAQPTAHERELRAWLAAGRHGSMAWMALKSITSSNRTGDPRRPSSR